MLSYATAGSVGEIVRIAPLHKCSVFGSTSRETTFAVAVPTSAPTAGEASVNPVGTTSSTLPTGSSACCLDTVIDSV